MKKSIKKKNKSADQKL